MMYDVSLTVILTATAFMALSTVYLWSKDPARRSRARELLTLLLGR